VGHSAFNDRYFHQVLFSIIDSLCNGVCYFIGFAKSITDNTVTITDHYDGCEAEPATTFYNFGYTFNGNDPFLKIDFACFYCTDIAY
jgi:hypothetical protein